MGTRGQSWWFHLEGSTSEIRVQDAFSLGLPIGSTQNVGSSVNVERTPDAYDSSPMLRPHGTEARNDVG